MRKLVELRPQWLESGERHRYQMGVSILCPAHPEKGHRVRLWFVNPADSYLPLTPSQMSDPEDMPVLYWREGYMLQHLTVTYQGRNLGEPIVTPHWRGWIVEGEVWDAGL